MGSAGPEIGTVGTQGRIAAADDIHRIGELFSAAVEELSTQRGGTALLGDLSDRTGINLLVPAGRWKVLTEGLSRSVPSFWVGSDSAGRVAGFAWARVAHHGEFSPLLGVIDLSFVEPGARRYGTAETILATVQAWFIDQGCTAMDAYALPGERDSKATLETAGFKARLLVMSRDIGEEARVPAPADPVVAR